MGTVGKGLRPSSVKKSSRHFRQFKCGHSPISGYFLDSMSRAYWGFIKIITPEYCSIIMLSYSGDTLSLLAIDLLGYEFLSKVWIRTECIDMVTFSG